MAFMDIISGALKPAKELISEFITDKDKKNELIAAIEQAEIDADVRIGEAQAAVIQAEATGKSWLQRNWRPLTMLTFVALVVLRWLGVTEDNIPLEIERELMTLIQIGLGGYVVGRSVEKVAQPVAQALTKK